MIPPNTTVDNADVFSPNPDQHYDDDMRDIADDDFLNPDRNNLNRASTSESNPFSDSHRDPFADDREIKTGNPVNSNGYSLATNEKGPGQGPLYVFASTADKDSTTEIYKRKHTYAFYCYIVLAIISILLTIPFQIFIICDLTVPSKLNDFLINGSLNLLGIMMVRVTFSCLGLAQIFEFVICVRTLFSKNAYHLLYLFVFTIFVQVASVPFYLDILRIDQDLHLPAAEFTRSKICLYWLITFPFFPLLLEAIVFFTLLRKNLNWNLYKTLSFTTRRSVLIIEHFKILLVLATFFVHFDLLLSINFPYEAFYGYFDATSITSIIVIIITPLAFCYLRFVLHARSIMGLSFGLAYILFIYALSLVNSYMFNTYGYFPDGDFFKDYMLVYSFYIFSLRGWFSFFHYLVLIILFILCVKMISLFLWENKHTKKVASSEEKKTWSFMNKAYNLLPQNVLNSQYNSSNYDGDKEVDLDLYSPDILERTIASYLTLDTIFSIILAIALIGLQVYLYLEKPSFMRPHMALSIMCGIPIIFFSAWGTWTWNRNYKKQTKRAKVYKCKYFLFCKIFLLFIWFNNYIFELFLIMNWRNYNQSTFRSLIYGIEMSYALFFNNGKRSDYDSVYPQFLQHSTTAFVIVLVAVSLIGIFTIAETLVCGYVEFYFNKLESLTQGTYFNESNRFDGVTSPYTIKTEKMYIYMRIVAAFCAYLGAIATNFLANFEFDFLEDNNIQNLIGIDVQPIKEEFAIFWILNWSFTAFNFLIVLSLLSWFIARFLPIDTRRFTCTVLFVLNTAYIALVAYEFFYTYKLYDILVDYGILTNYFYLVFSMFTAQWILLIYVLIISVQVFLRLGKY